MLLNNQWITEETKRQLGKKENAPKPMRHGKSSFKTEVYSITILTQETSKK